MRPLRHIEREEEEIEESRKHGMGLEDLGHVRIRTQYEAVLRSPRQL